MEVEVDLLCGPIMTVYVQRLHWCTSALKLPGAFFILLLPLIIFWPSWKTSNKVLANSCISCHVTAWNCFSLEQFALLIVLDIDSPSMSWHQAVVLMGKSSYVCDSYVTLCTKLAGDLHCDNPCSSFAAKSNPEVTALLQTAWTGIFSFGWRTLLRDSIYHPWLPQW